MNGESATIAATLSSSPLPPPPPLNATALLNTSTVSSIANKPPFASSSAAPASAPAFKTRREEERRTKAAQLWQKVRDSFDDGKLKKCAATTTLATARVPDVKLGEGMRIPGGSDISVALRRTYQTRSEMFAFYFSAKVISSPFMSDMLSVLFWLVVIDNFRHSAGVEYLAALFANFSFFFGVFSLKYEQEYRLEVAMSSTPSAAQHTSGLGSKSDWRSPFVELAATTLQLALEHTFPTEHSVVCGSAFLLKMKTDLQVWIIGIPMSEFNGSGSGGGNDADDNEGRSGGERGAGDSQEGGDRKERLQGKHNNHIATSTTSRLNKGIIREDGSFSMKAANMLFIAQLSQHDGTTKTIRQRPTSAHKLDKRQAIKAKVKEGRVGGESEELFDSSESLLTNKMSKSRKNNNPEEWEETRQFKRADFTQPAFHRNHEQILRSVVETLARTTFGSSSGVSGGNNAVTFTTGPSSKPSLFVSPAAAAAATAAATSSPPSPPMADNNSNTNNTPLSPPPALTTTTTANAASAMLTTPSRTTSAEDAVSKVEAQLAEEYKRAKEEGHRRVPFSTRHQALLSEQDSKINSNNGNGGSRAMDYNEAIEKIQFEYMVKMESFCREQIAKIGKPIFADQQALEQEEKLKRIAGRSGENSATFEPFNQLKAHEYVPNKAQITEKFNLDMSSPVLRIFLSFAVGTAKATFLKGNRGGDVSVASSDMNNSHTSSSSQLFSHAQRMELPMRTEKLLDPRTSSLLRDGADDENSYYSHFYSSSVGNNSSASTTRAPAPKNYPHGSLLDNSGLGSYTVVERQFIDFISALSERKTTRSLTREKFALHCSQGHSLLTVDPRLFKLQKQQQQRGNSNIDGNDTTIQHGDDDGDGNEKNGGSSKTAARFENYVITPDNLNDYLAGNEDVKSSRLGHNNAYDSHQRRNVVIPPFCSMCSSSSSCDVGNQDEDKNDQNAASDSESAPPQSKQRQQCKQQKQTTLYYCAICDQALCRNCRPPFGSAAKITASTANINSGGGTSPSTTNDSGSDNQQQQQGQQNSCRRLAIVNTADFSPDLIFGHEMASRVFAPEQRTEVVESKFSKMVTANFDIRQHQQHSQVQQQPPVAQLHPPTPLSTFSRMEVDNKSIRRSDNENTAVAIQERSVASGKNNNNPLRSTTDPPPSLSSSAATKTILKSNTVSAVTPPRPQSAMAVMMVKGNGNGGGGGISNGTANTTIDNTCNSNNKSTFSYYRPSSAIGLRRPMTSSFSSSRPSSACRPSSALRKSTFLHSIGLGGGGGGKSAVLGDFISAENDSKNKKPISHQSWGGGGSTPAAAAVATTSKASENNNNNNKMTSSTYTSLNNSNATHHQQQQQRQITPKVFDEKEEKDKVLKEDNTAWVIGTRELITGEEIPIQRKIQSASLQHRSAFEAFNTTNAILIAAAAEKEKKEKKHQKAGKIEGDEEEEGGAEGEGDEGDWQKRSGLQHSPPSSSSRHHQHHHEGSNQNRISETNSNDSPQQRRLSLDSRPTTSPPPSPQQKQFVDVAGSKNNNKDTPPSTRHHGTPTSAHLMLKRKKRTAQKETDGNIILNASPSSLCCDDPSFTATTTAATARGREVVPKNDNDANDAIDINTSGSSSHQHYRNNNSPHRKDSLLLSSSSSCLSLSTSILQVVRAQAVTNALRENSKAREASRRIGFGIATKSGGAAVSERGGGGSAVAVVGNGGGGSETIFNDNPLNNNHPMNISSKKNQSSPFFNTTMTVANSLKEEHKRQDEEDRERLERERANATAAAAAPTTSILTCFASGGTAHKTAHGKSSASAIKWSAADANTVTSFNRVREDILKRTNLSLSHIAEIKRSEAEAKQKSLENEKDNHIYESCSVVEGLQRARELERILKRDQHRAVTDALSKATAIIEERLVKFNEAPPTLEHRHTFNKLLLTEINHQKQNLIHLRDLLYELPTSTHQIVHKFVCERRIYIHELTLTFRANNHDLSPFWPKGLGDVYTLTTPEEFAKLTQTLEEAAEEEIRRRRSRVVNGHEEEENEDEEETEEDRKERDRLLTKMRRAQGRSASIMGTGGGNSLNTSVDEERNDPNQKRTSLSASSISASAAAAFAAAIAADLNPNANNSMKTMNQKQSLPSPFVVQKQQQQHQHSSPSSSPQNRRRPPLVPKPTEAIMVPATTDRLKAARDKQWADTRDALFSRQVTDAEAEAERRKQLAATAHVQEAIRENKMAQKEANDMFNMLSAVIVPPASSSAAANSSNNKTGENTKQPLTKSSSFASTSFSPSAGKGRNSVLKNNDERRDGEKSIFEISATNANGKANRDEDQEDKNGDDDVGGDDKEKARRHQQQHHERFKQHAEHIRTVAGVKKTQLGANIVSIGGQMQWEDSGLPIGSSAAAYLLGVRRHYKSSK